MTDPATPPDVERITARLKDLPNLPTVVAELIQSMNKEDVDIPRLKRSLEHDPALAGKVLRLANSPFFGMRGRIGTIQDAITVLGLRSLRSLIVASGLRMCFSGTADHAIELKRFWIHAFETALAARELARCAKLSADTAFMAGLLHDIGKLAIWSLEPQWGVRITQWCEQNHGSWTEGERALALPGHAAIGTALARKWNLPEELCDAISDHDVTGREAPPLASVVQVADTIASAFAYLRLPVFHIAPIDPVAWRAIGIDSTAMLRAAHAVRLAGVASDAFS